MLVLTPNYIFSHAENNVYLGYWSDCGSNDNCFDLYADNTDFMSYTSSVVSNMEWMYDPKAKCYILIKVLKHSALQLKQYVALVFHFCCIMGWITSSYRKVCRKTWLNSIVAGPWTLRSLHGYISAHNIGIPCHVIIKTWMNQAQGENDKI